ncbi:C163A-like protein [Mya arenaria]|uniref:C163A-like protein n=1 Tax=Mya arenaria TaxID=6604 RepID=A0ABY7ECB8_MYAAR|nr:C163A-like protein [Mya arenaria]
MWVMAVKCVMIILVLFGILQTALCYELQLTGGQGEGQGQVNVRQRPGEVWGVVCDRGFGSNEAEVVCRHLGYKHARVEDKVYKESYPQYVLDQVSCHGDERDLEHCNHDNYGTHSCYTNFFSPAGVCCSNSSTFGGCVLAEETNPAVLHKGDTCACLQQNTVVPRVSPTKCSASCPGDDNRYCGAADGKLWNMYTTASDGSLSILREPGKDDVGQCAVLVNNKNVGSKKLMTSQCELDRGYICQDFQKREQDLDMLFFKEPTDYLSTAGARKACRNITDHELIGADILERRKLYGDYDELWVDFSRVRTDIDTYLNVSSFKSLQPKWCLSVTSRNVKASLTCNERRLYTCTPVEGRSQPVTKPANGGSTEAQSPAKDTKPGTTAPHLTTTPDKARQREYNYNEELLHLSLIICSAVVVAVIIITIIICWIKRLRGKSSGICCLKSDTGDDPRTRTLTGNEYSATFHAGSTGQDDHMYDVIQEKENVYLELDPLIENKDNSTCVASEGSGENGLGSGCGQNDSGLLKEPVTMQRSYSHPNDMVKIGNTNEISKIDTYTYPYDIVYRPEDVKSANSSEQVNIAGKYDKKKVVDSVSSVGNAEENADNNIYTQHLQKPDDGTTATIAVPANNLSESAEAVVLRKERRSEPVKTVEVDCRETPLRNSAS